MIIHLLGGRDETAFPPAAFDLLENEAYIGRLPSCLINVQDDSISRLHARVYIDTDSWWVEDLRSRNGIFINGKQVYQSILIEGDIITTGDVYFTLNHHQTDQIEHLQDWVNERIENARQCHQEISKLQNHEISFEESGLIQSLPEPTIPQVILEPQQPSTPTIETPIVEPPAPITPVTEENPVEINPAAQTPTVHPTPAPVASPLPQVTPVVPQAGHPPAAAPQPQPHPPSADSNRPVAENVMGNDNAVITVIVVAVVLLLVGLIWKFKDVFMPDRSFHQPQSSIHLHILPDNPEV